MRLAADAATQSFQVALDGREPLLQACPRQIRREPAVESPRPLFGAVQVGHDATSDNLKSKTHARQKPIELLVAQLDLPGYELADAGLVHPADTGQLGLGGARFEHHLAEQATSTRHDSTIAFYAIEIAQPGDRFAKFRGGALATDWQHQNRKQPNSASNDQPLKVDLTCSFVDLHLRQIVVFWLSGGGSASSDLAGGADYSA
jgi:hypothetical protein